MSDHVKAAIPEPAPKDNNHPAIADLVAGDMATLGYTAMIGDVMARKAMGIRKYGMPLKPLDGRDTLNDLYQELLDAIKYTKKQILETQLQHADNDPDIYDLYKALITYANVIRRKMNEHQNSGNKGGSKTVSEG